MRTLAVGGVADGEVIEGEDRHGAVISVPRLKRISDVPMMVHDRDETIAQVERSFYRTIRLSWASSEKKGDPLVWTFWADCDEIKNDGDLLNRLFANYRPVHRE